MLVDLRKHAAAASFDCDIAIVGAGAAGLTRARHLAGRGRDTRMSDLPAEGMVDRDCRVHGNANLDVAGSSVFRTAGWANPTLTILALAHRLGDHLLARSA